MSERSLHYNARAKNDLREIIDYYAETAGDFPVHRFLGEMGKAFRHIARAPGTGSPRYQKELDAPGIRFWKVTRFPHLVFYVELANAVRILRVMHGKRDISHRFHTA